MSDSDCLTTTSNRDIADALHEVADLLEDQAANPFRVAAYRVAAETLRQHDESVHAIFQREGTQGLMQLEGVGKSISHSIGQLIRTGRLPLLERLRGDHDAERLFATVPDIGPGLARRIHEHLSIETLPELEAAAIDGRLAKVPGMGTKRIRAVRESLAGRFRISQAVRSDRHDENDSDVTVAELLDIDAEYRQLASNNELPRIAPRRFNPAGEAWLPIFHTERDDKHFTVLFSNTARAHQMHTTHDWVVIYRDDEGDHGRWTVITSQFGRLKGQRIVRGREDDCLEYYGV